MQGQRPDSYQPGADGVPDERSLLVGVQVAPGKCQAEGTSYLPEAGVRRETRNDGIVFFRTDTEDRGENRLFQQPL